MVKIVTGKINTYKSTKLKKHYEDHLLGDGFIAKKNMQGKLVHSYDLVKLSTNKSLPYIIRDKFYDGSSTLAFKIGPYCFLKSGLDYLENEIDKMIEEGCSPIYIDEISLLELNEKGLYKIFKRLLALDIDLCIVVREDLLEKVLEKFSIEKYEIIGD
ncbi:MAG: nucleoside-triphosphatase [Candidatus Izemoplasmatales bacterium]